jgi:hypothetical protein
VVMRLPHRDRAAGDLGKDLASGRGKVVHILEDWI